MSSNVAEMALRRVRSRRAAFTTLAVLVVPVALAACGDAGDTSSTTSVAIRTTDFVTIPPVVTEPPGPTTIPPTIDVEQEYVVQAGDYPLAVANKFGITLDELVAYNGWVDVTTGFPFPGTTIKIPPGAKNPAATATPGDTTPAVNDPGLLTVPPGSTIAGGQDNSGEGTYTIEEGDYPVKIAEKFDVTVDALAQANGWQDLTADFPYPGTVIKIPAKQTEE